MKEINNDITESYCSFEVSKLLKEKGFDCKCEDCFNSRGMLFSNGWCEDVYDKGVNIPFNNSTLKSLFHISRPTHALAIEWIRVNFNIFIHTTCDVGGEFIYTFTIYNVNFGEEQCLYSSRLLYESPQIATDSSLKYVLKELI